MYYAPESDFRVTIYDYLNFSRALVVQLQPSRYIMRLNRTSVWKVMTIWISRQHSLSNFRRLDVICAWIGLPCDNLWPFEFLDSFRFLISSVSIYYATESDFRLKSYDHLNFSRAFVVQFRASFWAFWYIYCLLSKTGPDGRRETRGTGTRETARKPRQDFSVSKVIFSHCLWLSMSHNVKGKWALLAPLKWRHVALLK